MPSLPFFSRSDSGRPSANFLERMSSKLVFSSLKSFKWSDIKCLAWHDGHFTSVVPWKKPCLLMRCTLRCEHGLQVNESWKLGTLS